MSMQVSWNNRAASVGYAKQAETDGKQPTTWSMTAGQDQITISPEARAAYENSVNEAAESNTGTLEKMTFPNPFEELDKMFDEYDEIINDYYQAQVEENNRFADPMQHMNDKYKNPNSPYFRWDMTAEERETAWASEWEIYQYGHVVTGNYADNYALRQANVTEGDLYFPKMLGEAVQNARNGIGESIRAELERQGIILPEGISLCLTIDPYDYLIHVEGLEDDALAQKIEDALNDGKNGYNLYYSLRLSDPEKATANAATYKTGLYHLTKQLTGYNMRELQSGDGHFYLPDGRELWSVLEELVNGMGAQKAGDIGLEQYHHTYTYLGLRGWDGAPDADLSIDYVNGQLKEVSDEPVQSENTDTEEPAPPEEPNPEEEFAFTDPNYGLWMLEDGKFHHYQVPITKADLQQMADEIRNGKAPMEPVWTNSKAD